MRIASMRGRGGSAKMRWGGSPDWTQRQNFFSAETRTLRYSGSMGIVISTHLPPPVMIDSTASRECVTHILCWTWAMYFSAAASSENDHGSMNLASNIASVSSMMPSRVAAIHGMAECLTRRWMSVTRRPVLRSYQERLSSSVAAPSCTTKLPDRSSGFASPRFSRQSWIRAASSLPMMMRASEPPMKQRRSIFRAHFDLSWGILAYLYRDQFHSILKVSNIMSRKSILKVSIRQIKAARALLSWSQEELAEAAGVSTPTIKRLEARDGPIGGRTNTAAKIRTALEDGGVEFIDENGGGRGVRLRKRARPRGATIRLKVL